MGLLVKELFDGLAVAEGPALAGAGATEWARAFDVWLSDKAPNTQRSYRRAWDDLCAFTGKTPDAILGADVQEWVEDLGLRPLDPRVLKGLQGKGRRSGDQARGLSASTIALWLSAISSFYHFVSTRYLVRTPGGGERPLHGYNPAASVRRPDVRSYARADYLDAGQLRRLLAAIPRATVRGLRDYALFLGYVLTGRRNAEWRGLRWDDLRGRGPRIFYTWRGKRTEEARNELPPPVWDAIRDYLEAAGWLGDSLGQPWRTIYGRLLPLAEVEAMRPTGDE
jgi:integrase